MITTEKVQSNMSIHVYRNDRVPRRTLEFRCMYAIRRISLSEPCLVQSIAWHLRVSREPDRICYKDLPT